MTTSWITQLSMEPVLIGVGVDNTAVTHRLIIGGGSFTVNLWSADDTKSFVKFSKPAVLDRPTATHPQRPPGPPRRRPARRCSTRRSHGSTARSATRSTSAPTRCSWVRSSPPASHDPEARAGGDVRHPDEVRRRQTPLMTHRRPRPLPRGVRQRRRGRAAHRFVSSLDRAGTSGRVVRGPGGLPWRFAASGARRLPR